MDANDLTAVATVAGVVVAVVFGLGGLVVGIIGLVQASLAKAAAKGANAIAAEANQLSKEANNLVEAQDARLTERSDVEWEWSWDTAAPDTVIIENIGKGLAKGVVAQFWVGDFRKANAESPTDVEGQNAITLIIPEMGEMRRVAATHSEADRISGNNPRIPAARTRLRVTWQTPLGSFGKHDTGYQISELLTSSDDLNYLVWWEGRPTSPPAT